jgi:putative transposase
MITRLAGRRDRDGVRTHESAQHRWRAVNSAHLVALVRAGAKFENGVLVERPDESPSGDTHAA